MIRKILLLLVFIALSSAVIADDANQHKIDSDQSKDNMEQAERQDPGLVHFLNLSKKAKEIKEYKGIFFDFKFITRTPDVFVKLVEKSENVATPKSCTLLTQFQKFPDAVDASYRAKVSAFSTDMKNANYMTESKLSEQDGVTRFNYIDKQKRIHLSYWLNQENGFLVQRAVFDENQKLLAFSGYRDLKFRDANDDLNKICAAKDENGFLKNLKIDLTNLTEFELKDIETFCSGHDLHEFR